MNKQKFSRFKGNEYDSRYRRCQPDFYSDAAGLVLRTAEDNSAVLDIGSGPGTLADLCSKSSDGKRIRIYGIEPSGLHEQGLLLSAKLHSQKSSIEYEPLNLGIEHITSEQHFDGSDIKMISFLRSAHEIAISLGGKSGFYSALKQLLSGFPTVSHILIADPCYASAIRRNPADFCGLLEKIIAINTELIGHCEMPEQLFSMIELASFGEQAGLELEYCRLHPNLQLLQRLQQIQEYHNLQDSPVNLFVALFRRTER